jgi:2-isopropylmalate synthase
VDDEIMRGHDAISIKALRVESGTGIIPVASLTLDVSGTVKSVTTSGDGPVDAIFMAIREAFPHTATLQLFQINAVTEGTDAQATVSVRLEENGRTVTGKGSDTDTMVAAAYAYVNALNKLLVKREKQAPEALTIAR